MLAYLLTEHDKLLYNYINIIMNKSRYVFFILACLFGLYVQAQNRTVKGRVLSAEDKEPLIGATVKIPGTSIGVVTDIRWQFLSGSSQQRQNISD